MHRHGILRWYWRRAAAGAPLVEKGALNAVMAGCRPEYLPWVIAALEAACTDEFNVHGVMATTMGASIGGKPNAGKPGTVVGEILDFSCYLQIGKHGEKHRSCAQKCFTAGQPVGLLAQDHAGAADRLLYRRMDDPSLRTILSTSPTVAVLGIHHDPSRPANYVPAYLHQRGYPRSRKPRRSKWW